MLISPPSNLQVVEVSESSLSVAWDIVQAQQPEYVIVLFKGTALSDGYNNTAKSFLPSKISTIAIRGLASGTSYTVKKVSVRDGQYENGGAFVVGTASGMSECGNGVLDNRGGCDEGTQYGSGVVGECNSDCVFTVEFDDSSQPSSHPASKPQACPGAPHPSHHLSPVRCRR